MAKKKTNLTGETEALAENADKRLDAARKIAKANAIMAESEGEETPPETPPMTPSPEQIEPSKMERIMLELGGEGKFTVEKIVAGRPIKVGVYPIADWPTRWRSSPVSMAGCSLSSRGRLTPAMRLERR